MTGDHLARLVEYARFLAIAHEESKRTVYAGPDIIDQVRAAVTRNGLDDIWTVRETPYVPAGQIIVADENALEAMTREAIQRVSFRRRT